MPSNAFGMVSKRMEDTSLPVTASLKGIRARRAGALPVIRHRRPKTKAYGT